jgi:hypothetical protein
MWFNMILQPKLWRQSWFNSIQFNLFNIHHSYNRNSWTSCGSVPHVVCTLKVRYACTKVCTLWPRLDRCRRLRWWTLGAWSQEGQDWLAAMKTRPGSLQWRALVVTGAESGAFGQTRVLGGRRVAGVELSFACPQTVDGTLCRGLSAQHSLYPLEQPGAAHWKVGSLLCCTFIG